MGRDSSCRRAFCRQRPAESPRENAVLRVATVCSAPSGIAFVRGLLRPVDNHQAIVVGAIDDSCVVGLFAHVGYSSSATVFPARTKLSRCVSWMNNVVRSETGLSSVVQLPG